MRFIKELPSLAWTLAGTALVLITLSGETQKWGLIISVAAFVLQMFSLAIDSDEDEEEV